jgi:hypothetical protein
MLMQSSPLCTLLHGDTAAFKTAAAKISATWGGCVAGENGGSFCQTYRIITNSGTTTVITHGETMLNTDGSNRCYLYTACSFCSSAVLLLLAVA